MNKPRQHSSKLKLLKEKALEGGLGLEKAVFKTEDHWLLPVMCTMKILRFSIWTSSGRRAIAERTVLSPRSIKATRERTFTCTSPVWTFQLLTKDWRHQKAGKWRIPCIPVMCHGSAMTNSTNHLLVAYYFNNFHVKHIIQEISQIHDGKFPTDSHFRMKIILPSHMP